MNDFRTCAVLFPLLADRLGDQVWNVSHVYADPALAALLTISPKSLGRLLSRTQGHRLDNHMVIACGRDGSGTIWRIVTFDHIDATVVGFTSNALYKK